MRYFLLLFLLCSSCINTHTDRIFKKMDPLFFPYLEQFWHDSTRFGNTQLGRAVPINFYSITSQSDLGVAECIRYDYPDISSRYDYEILIDETAWNRFSEIDKKSLIYHQLGHCLLERPDDNTMVVFEGEEIPASIMHNSIEFILDGSERDDMYLLELFTWNQSHWTE